jgi:hypothetical protein
MYNAIYNFREPKNETVLTCAPGTNDMPGSHLNLVRWGSPSSIKETLIPATDFRYPFLKS